jgi:hypothetical protein
MLSPRFIYQTLSHFLLFCLHSCSLRSASAVYPFPNEDRGAVGAQSAWTLAYFYSCASLTDRLLRGNCLRTCNMFIRVMNRAWQLSLLHQNTFLRCTLLRFRLQISGRTQIHVVLKCVSSRIAPLPLLTLPRNLESGTGTVSNWRNSYKIHPKWPLNVTEPKTMRRISIVQLHYSLWSTLP